MPEEGDGDALIEFLVVHQRDGLALGQSTHQFAGADALGCVDLGAIGRAEIRDASINMGVVQGAIGHHRVRQALGDRGGHDFPIGKVAGNEDRTLVAGLQAIQHVKTDNVYSSRRVRIDGWQVRQLACDAAGTLPCIECGLLDLYICPIRKSEPEIALHCLVLGKARADLLHQPATKIGGTIWAEQLHRPPIE